MARRCASPAFIGLVALLVLWEAEHPRMEPLSLSPLGGQASLTTEQAMAVGERLRQQQEQGRLLQAGRDPGMVALSDCNHSVRNASGAPWLIDQMARDCEERSAGVDQSHPQLKGEVQKCWGPLDSAITLLREANEKFTEARRAVDPMRGQLVKEGNDKQQQAKDEIKKCDTCADKLFKLAADLGATMLKEVMAQLDQMRRGQLPSSVRAGPTPDPTTWPTPPTGPAPAPGPPRTPTPTRPIGGPTTPPPSSPSGGPCPDAATVRSYADQRAIGATLPNPQRGQYEARLERWYQNQISECRLQELNAQLAPYAQGLQQAGDFSFAMRQAAEALLRAAGQISKAMTDATDVTTHNNVGVGVALGGYLGALGRLREVLSLTAREYQAAAAAVRGASEQKAALVVANVAKTQAGIAAEEAAQIARNVAAEVGPPPLTPPIGAAPSMPPTPGGYLSNIQIIDKVVPQGNLPTCGVFACQRLADLLGRNVSFFQAFNALRPRLIGAIEEKVVEGRTISEFVLKGGLRPDQIEEGLRALGIPAQVAYRFTDLTNEVFAGRPAIALLKTDAQGTNFHWVVVEAMETRAGVPGLTIYDPIGRAYWQPLSDLQRCFSGIFVRAL